MENKILTKPTHGPLVGREYGPYRSENGLLSFSNPTKTNGSHLGLNQNVEHALPRHL